jgi:hypothetical protein
LHQPHYRRMAHIVGPGDVDQRLACCSTCNRLLPLMRRQLGLAAEPDATSLRAFPPFAGPGADQLALELGKATEHSQHEPAVRRRGVSPVSATDLKPPPAFAIVSRMFKEIARRAYQRSPSLNSRLAKVSTALYLVAISRNALDERPRHLPLL